MILFSLVEGVNKILGIFIVMLVARILTVDQFVKYSSILVVFGYLYQLSQFGLPKKNLIDMAGDEGFVYKDIFLHRVCLIILLSFSSAALFCWYYLDEKDFYILPLVASLALSFLTVDFYIFGIGRSNVIVVGRLLSQIVGLTALVYIFISDQYFGGILYVNFFQTITLTLVMLLFVTMNTKFDATKWLVALSGVKGALKGAGYSFKEQLPVFLAGLLVSVVVGYEVAVLGGRELDSVRDMVIGNRIAIILLPFIHFYLSSNVSNIGKDGYLKYMLSVSMGVLLLILVSPIVVRMLLGNGYILDGYFMNYYLPIILFQAVVNYEYYISLKRSSVGRLFKSIACVLCLSGVGMYVVSEIYIMSREAVLAIVFAKVVVLVLTFGNITIASRLITVFVYVGLLVLNYCLVISGYFDFLDDVWASIYGLYQIWI